MHMRFNIVSSNLKDAKIASLSFPWLSDEKMIIIGYNSTIRLVMCGLTFLPCIIMPPLLIIIIPICIFILKETTSKKKYLLSSDIGYVYSQEMFYEREKIIKGSPAAKMLITGLAAKSYQSGHGFLAGLLASGASNVQADDTVCTETTSKTLVTVYTMDGFFYRFSPNEKTIGKLSRNTVFDDLDEWKIYCRMLDDGIRVADELKEERKGLLELIEEKSQLSENCISFKGREEERTELHQANALLSKVNCIIDGIEKYAGNQNA